VRLGAAELMMATYACGIPVMIMTHVNHSPFIYDENKLHHSTNN